MEFTMKERTEPAFIQFKAGQTVSGVMVACEKTMIQGKPATKFVLDNEGIRVAFLGTYQINQKLGRSDLGHFVRIKYVGEDTKVGREGNQMRVFDVAVSMELAVPQEAEYSDTEIPF
jgi:hypothetical protein